MQRPILGITLAQKRIAECIGSFYGAPGTPLYNAGTQYQLAMEKLDEDARIQLVIFTFIIDRMNHIVSLFWNLLGG